jgi:hypothetical protein
MTKRLVNGGAFFSPLELVPLILLGSFAAVGGLILLKLRTHRFFFRDHYPPRILPGEEKQTTNRHHLNLGILP